MPVRVTFRGVRGSTPTPGESTRRYGGNTSCVTVEAGGELLVLDLGTGLRGLGTDVSSPVRATVLLTHLHFDHVQGLPFCTGLLQAGAEVELYGPTPDGGESLEAAVRSFLRPPLFPVALADLPCSVGFHELDDAFFGVGEAKVRGLPVPHRGVTAGFRIEAGGASLAYVPDHQMPTDGSGFVDERVLELCHDVDLLIHDSQYTPAEFAARPDWGHCTVDYAVHVAATAGARRLALFHHDPSHDDDTIDRLLGEARVAGCRRGVEVIAPAEGDTVEVREHAGAPHRPN